MAYWILKTEPSSYGYANLERDGTTRWDGVKNPLALKHIRSMRRGDDVLIYHTGKEKALVGKARVNTDPYPDPGADNPALVVVDLEASGPLATPVPLSAIKAEQSFADLALVRMGRLSVVPATPSQWKRLLKMAGE
ncbi:MAG TPA: EVE domain-containing protein [Gemmatimonadales bacterium]|nr:EVE domain-containing protein [Gemmatimonadales bacterium]